MLGTYDRLSLLTEAKAQYTLNDPLHGVEHWLAVEAAGVEIASELDADTEIASIFGLLHDARRQSSDTDPEHGARAAELAVELNGKHYKLPNNRLNKLVDALYWHDAGLVVSDLDIMCCWAADRLQLTRVGITPQEWGFCDRTWLIIQRMMAGDIEQVAA